MRAADAPAFSGVEAPTSRVERNNQGMSTRIMGWAPFVVFLVLALAGSAIGYLQFRS